MIARATQSGRGVHLILTTAEAQRLAMALAVADVAEGFYHEVRREMLPRLSELAWGGRDVWQRIPGAILPDGTTVQQRHDGAKGYKHGL